jgi:small GTP-binding protein
MAAEHQSPQPKVVLVGNPNVGKSVLFNVLTGAYTTVSNYPGTSVEVSRGQCEIAGTSYEILDTPGMYSVMPITEEERVARQILLNESPHAVVHVIDARNIERMLPMTLQLIEAGLPLILVVNILDEAQGASAAAPAARYIVPIAATPTPPPGSDLELLQNFPSYIFKVGHSQFAVDDSLAREIHIRRPS